MRKWQKDVDLRWQGFKDAILHGAKDPGKWEKGGNVADDPNYRDGFKVGMEIREKCGA